MNTIYTTGRVRIKPGKEWLRWTPHTVKDDRCRLFAFSSFTVMKHRWIKSFKKKVKDWKIKSCFAMDWFYLFPSYPSALLPFHVRRHLVGYGVIRWLLQSVQQPRKRLGKPATRGIRRTTWTFAVWMRGLENAKTESTIVESTVETYVFYFFKFYRTAININ